MYVRCVRFSEEERRKRRREKMKEGFVDFVAPSERRRSVQSASGEEVEPNGGGAAVGEEKPARRGEGREGWDVACSSASS